MAGEEETRGEERRGEAGLLVVFLLQQIAFL